jgi:hypothetical protein
MSEFLYTVGMWCGVFGYATAAGLGLYAGLIGGARMFGPIRVSQTVQQTTTVVHQ